jgi:hypothetical protein
MIGKPTKATKGKPATEIMFALDHGGSADFVIDERLTGSNTMQRFLVYRCPNTGMNVQASFVLKDGDEPEDRSELYETANCPACGSVHLVNRSTGKLLREKIDKWFQPPKPQ